MTDDDTPESVQHDGYVRLPAYAEPPRRSWFAIPPTLKRIFDQFPLITYTENGLPLRALNRTGWREKTNHILHTFSADVDARNGRPSFNPACLKWQTYLKLAGLDFRTTSSNNHASPSGALPFLLPAALPQSNAVPAHKLKKWASLHTLAEKVEEPSDVRHEVYAPLMDDRIRKAWLYQLYLNPANTPLVHCLYVAPCSSNPFVQMAISLQLSSAARAELVKASASNIIAEAKIIRDAQVAMEALSILLGQNTWFFGGSGPSLFDASVFAYTHLILDEAMGWVDNKLADQLKSYGNLVLHQQRILQMYF